ncbi:unnamed protein product [Trichobilharzia szidati]|nr:unnamed protein product [Trichobilharzia szidati]
MGSHLSSAGRKSVVSNTHTQRDEMNTRQSQKHVNYNEATNTNARDHGHTDRLKTLFHDNRTLKTLSEQKVNEWLLKNKQYYGALPKDMIEIPEHICSLPDNQVSTWVHDGSSNAKSDTSPSKKESQKHRQGSFDGIGAKGNHDKMNHYCYKNSDYKSIRNVCIPIQSKNDSYAHYRYQCFFHHQCQPQTLRMSSVKCTKDYRKHSQHGNDVFHRNEMNSITPENSRSDKADRRDLDTLPSCNKKIKKIPHNRRDSHSVVPSKSSTFNRKMNDNWYLNKVCLNQRRTLSNTLQNNALYSIKQSSTNISLSNLSSFKTLQNKFETKLHQHELQNLKSLRESNNPPIFNKSRFLKPLGSLNSIQRTMCKQTEPVNEMYNFFKSQKPIKGLQKFASIWMNSPEKYLNKRSSYLG